jgi:hypothetical protein
MVRSLDPQYFDDRTEPGRRLNNMEIGMLMLAKLAESIEKYRPKRNNHTNVAEAVESLLKAAKARSRATGQSVSEVLREHRDALEEGGGTSKYVISASDSRQHGSSSSAMHAAMALQDERRATAEPSAISQAAASAVDAREGRLVPYAREELRPPSHVGTSTSVARRPAARHSAGGSNPNADHLRLMAPPAPPRAQRPLKLKHNPEGGGGMHNPHTL